MEQRWSATVILFLFLAIVFAGSGDYQQEQNEHIEYCEMVKGELWPDFKNAGCD